MPEFIDAKTLINMIVGGANYVTANTHSLNSLNVFPVPDGDTGTNMGHTVRSAASQAMQGSTSDISDVAGRASQGALMGARGNSGVILSQLFRGFAKGLAGKKTANAADIAYALDTASKMSYKAVMKPKEGTMLTIGRAAANAAQEIAKTEKDISVCLDYVIGKIETALDKTTEQLDVLKDAGVVDSGGLGILHFFKGVQLAMSNPPEKLLDSAASPSEGASVPHATRLEDITFAYCTEFLLIATQPQKAHSSLLALLPTVGDSVVAIEDAGIIKVHVHTNQPGLVLEEAAKFGQMTDIKIDNMQAQLASASPAAPLVSAAALDTAIIALTNGDGIAELFYALGAHLCINISPESTPDTSELTSAVSKTDAKSIILLPNDKSWILAANQAALLHDNVHVIPTEFLPQGIACLIANSDTISFEENLRNMNAARMDVRTGQIYSTKEDVVVDGHTVSSGEYICLLDGEVVRAGFIDLFAAARALVDHMFGGGGDIASVYHGQEVDSELADGLLQYIGEHYPNVEVEAHPGGMELYDFVISLE